MEDMILLLELALATPTDDGVECPCFSTEALEVAFAEVEVRCSLSLAGVRGQCVGDGHRAAVSWDALAQTCAVQAAPLEPVLHEAVSYEQALACEAVLRGLQSAR